MQHDPVQQLGNAYVWHDGDRWRFTTRQDEAPPHAELAQRLMVGADEVFHIQRIGAGEFVRGAVEAERSENGRTD